MKKPSVTVLVTVKNSVSTIKKCIDSILKLNYPKKKYSIFVVDAFSTDGTWEILKKYGKKIRLERVRGNIATGHNYMIKRCNTDFVALTDADCVVDENWLKYLIDAFKPEVIAAGGTPKTLSENNKLQELIGRELEDRFKRFPKYVIRLPTMSLCIRTEYAKKYLFDEKFDVAQETDWGFRISKVGKIAFVPKAVIYHYHRSTFKTFFKQQYTYGKFAFSLYSRGGNAKRVFGDWITKPSIALQVFLSYLGVLFLLLSLINSFFFYLSLIFFFTLLMTYFADALRLSKGIGEFFFFLIIFLFRNIAWCLGIVRGLFIKFK
jgi:GT2 family glycosyltransferase